jgi:3-methylcrotonyl-CoA carboxylase alpha subunit
VFNDSDGQPQRLDIVARKPDLVLQTGAQRVTVESPSNDDPARVRLQLNGQLAEGWRWVNGNDVYLQLAGRHWHFRRAGVEAGETAGASSSSELRADMPGTVVSIHVAAGVEVADGDRLITIESMKLQMILTAPRAARIRQIHVADNGSFDRGAVLISFDAPDTAAQGA